MNQFIYLVTLDKKNRLVLPLVARERLCLEGKVLLTVNGKKITLTKDNGDEDSKQISKNSFEVDGRRSVAVSTGDCGSPSPGSNPGGGPFYD